MANRITWQNVAAPNLNGVADTQLAVGSMFDRAANSLAGAFTGIGERKKNDASAKAMDAALKIRDVKGWDAMMSQGGLSALGINPGDASDDLISFVTNRRANLANGRAADQNFRSGELSYKQSEENLEQDQYGFGRTKLGDERSDANYALEQEQQVRNQLAQQTVQTLVTGTNSREAATREILNQDLDPQTEQAMLKALEARPDAEWQASEEFAGSMAERPAFALAQESLAMERRDANLKYGADEILQLYGSGTASQNQFGEGAQGVINSVKTWMDPSGENDAAFKDSAGKITNTYNSLMKEYRQLGPAIIQRVMETTLERTGMLGILNDRVGLDEGEIRKKLDKLNTPEQLARLNRTQSEMDRVYKEFDDRDKELNSLSAKYDLALTRGNQGQADRLLKQIQKISGLEEAPQTRPTAATNSPGLSLGAGIQRAPVPAGTGNRGFDAALSAAAATPAAPPEIQETAPAALAQSFNRRQNSGSRRVEQPAPAPVDAGPTIQMTGEERRNARTGGTQESQAIQEAAQDPQGTLTALVDRAEIPAKSKADAKKFLDILQKNEFPATGKPPTVAQRRMLQTRLREILEEAKGDDVTSDEIDELMSRPEAWLPF